MALSFLPESAPFAGADQATRGGRDLTDVSADSLGAPGAADAAGVWADAVTGWRSDLTRRLRVLLHTEPLLALRANDGRVADDLKHYDSLAIVLRAFDLILEHAGLDVGLAAPELRPALTPLLSAMDLRIGLNPDAARHDQVVDRVLGTLLNDAARREKFEATYCDITPDGVAADVVFHFRLLEEVHREGDGAIVLRLTSEAINLFLGALDHDIEDAQVAAEAVIREQLERGSFAKAVQTARDALLQSGRYVEKVDRVLQITRRDVRQADWRQEVPAILTAAMEHLDRRLTAERTILSAVDDQIQTLRPGSPEALHVAQVRLLVKQCVARHAELSARLVSARHTFLLEQGRQGFPEAVAGKRPTLSTDVLLPMLALPVVAAVEVADAALRSIGAPTPPPQLSLDALIGRLLQPRREVHANAVDVEGREMTDLPPELQRFPPIVRAVAERYLYELTEAAPLSTVLAKAAGDEMPSAVVEYLALRTLHLFGADPDHLVPVIAQPLGTTFTIGGVTGDDLLLVPLESSLPAIGAGGVHGADQVDSLGASELADAGAT